MVSNAALGANLKTKLVYSNLVIFNLFLIHGRLAPTDNKKPLANTPRKGLTKDSYSSRRMAHAG